MPKGNGSKPAQPSKKAEDDFFKQYSEENKAQGQDFNFNFGKSDSKVEPKKEEKPKEVDLFDLMGSNQAQAQPAQKNALDFFDGLDFSN